MTITEAAIAYRKSEDEQSKIEDQYLAIDDAEYELNERKKLIEKELKITTDQSHRERLKYRLEVIKTELEKQESIYQTWRAMFKQQQRYQKDLEKIFNKNNVLFIEYDRLFHGR